MNRSNCSQNTDNFFLSTLPHFAVSNPIKQWIESPLFNHLSDNELSKEWVPAVDFYQDKDNVIMEAELPGLKAEEIHVSLQNGVITLSGERKQEVREETNQKALRVERFYGKFERRFTLPIRVNSEEVSARYESGILRVNFPKAEEAKPKNIQIKVG